MPNAATASTPSTPSVGEFLAGHPEFVFLLREYLESTLHVDRARRRFEDFCRSFETENAIEGIWAANRTAIESIVGSLPGYRSISWTADRFWDSIPLISKASIRAKPGDFINPNYDKRKLWYRETSGTTGPPLAIWYDPEFFVEFQFFLVRKIAWVAGKLNDDVANRPIFCCALVDNRGLTNRLWPSPDEAFGLMLQITFDETSSRAVEKTAAELAELSPAILTLKPNILDFIVNHFNDDFRRAARHLELIISGGADLPNDLREACQEILGVPIINAYGLSEVGGIASECSEQAGLHIYAQDMIAEVLVDGDNLQPAGFGELVVSSIANTAMPFLRYRTGDIVELDWEPCKCGRRGPRLRNIQGRLFQNFRLRDGSEVSPVVFNRKLFELFPIREFRLTQTHLDRITAEIEFLPSCHDAASRLESIKERLEKEFRFSLNVDVSQVSFSQHGKFQRYRMLVPEQVS